MDTLTRMRAFIAVVEAEGFSAAARKIGRSKALLSKYVRELEDDLGALLLNRTTRQFSLTEAGHTYFRRASEIIREIDSLADSVRESSGDVKGRIKLSAPRTFADAPIGQSLIDFAAAHPDIVLDINLDDRFVDLVEEGFDLAIRIARLENSSLIARRLAPFSVKVCAAPALIERRGAPRRPQDLAGLPCIIDTNGRWLSNWPFIGDDGETVTVPVSGPIEVNSPLAARAAALAGLGFAILPDFIAAPEIEAGRLMTLFDDRMPT
ncbi:MAG: LysR family transcriptional regulator, partial [Nitratireductor sp.]